MEKISFFLEKFKELGFESALIKKIFIEEVEKVLSAKISPEDIKVNAGVLLVKAEPALKSELYLKRELILRELSKNLGPIKVVGLR